MSDDRDQSAEVERAMSEAQQQLSQGKHLQALQTALGAPTGGKEPQSVKDSAASQVANIIAAIKEADTTKIVEGLTEAERSTLLKYVFRSMAGAGQNYAALLKWHEKVVEKDGPGAIMRVLVDRNF